MFNSSKARLGKDDIWYHRQYPCALGTIVFVEKDGAVAVVQKARVKNYEFSNQWALPGGLVRGAHEKGFEAALISSVKKRALDEAGLQIYDVEKYEGPAGFDPLVTRYTVKGEEKFTLIIPMLAQASNGDEILTPRDKSIERAAWVGLENLAHTSFAPANKAAIYSIISQKYGFSVAGPKPTPAIEFCQENLRLLQNSMF